MTNSWSPSSQVLLFFCSGEAKQGSVFIEENPIACKKLIIININRHLKSSIAPYLKNTWTLAWAKEWATGNGKEDDRPSVNETRRWWQVDVTDILDKPKRPLTWFWHCKQTSMMHIWCSDNCFCKMLPMCACPKMQDMKCMRRLLVFEQLNWHCSLTKANLTKKYVYLLGFDWYLKKMKLGTKFERCGSNTVGWWAVSLFSKLPLKY